MAETERTREARARHHPADALRNLHPQPQTIPRAPAEPGKSGGEAVGSGILPDPARPADVSPQSGNSQKHAAAGLAEVFSHDLKVHAIRQAPASGRAFVHLCDHRQGLFHGWTTSGSTGRPATCCCCRSSPAAWSISISTCSPGRTAAGSHSPTCRSSITWPRSSPRPRSRRCSRANRERPDQTGGPARARAPAWSGRGFGRAGFGRAGANLGGILQGQESLSLVIPNARGRIAFDLYAAPRSPRISGNSFPGIRRSFPRTCRAPLRRTAEPANYLYALAPKDW